MDKIFLKNLKVKTRIGIFEWEKAVDQMININLILYLDIKKSAKSKKIEDSVNYKSISKRIISLAENNKFELVESMIENMAEIILNEYNIQQITISISKPGAIRGSDDVGIEITRP
jgi:dihydroneopterin aldolase